MEDSSHPLPSQFPFDLSAPVDPLPDPRPAGLVRVGPDGRILDADEEFQSLLGYSREELSGMTLRDLTAARREAEEDGFLRGQVPGAGVSAPFEMELVHRDGSPVQARIRAFPVRDEGGRPAGWWASVEDLRSWRWAGERARALRSAMDGAAEAVFILTESGRVVYANNLACESLGYTRNELLGMTVFDFDPNVPREGWPEHWARTREAGSTLFETVHQARDGRAFPVEVSISPMKLAGGEYHCAFARGISERLATQEALRESEERLRLALMAANQGLYDLNVQTGDAKVSPEYARMLGYEPETFRETNQAWLERLHPDDRPGVERNYRAYLAGESSVYAVEFRQRTASGEWKWILSLGKLVERDQEGRPLRMLGTHTDITERKRAEAEREKLQGQLLQAQKMESVGRLAGGVAHDFNNMLSVILGYSELIRAQADPGSSLAMDIEEIERAAARARDTTTQLLAFSRRQVIVPRTVDLNEIIAGTEKTLSRLIGEDVDVRFFPGGGLWNVRLDPSQFEQILVNLVVNARDAMVNGGHLTVETRNVELDEAFCREHAEACPGEYVQVAVSDDGVGMDRETAAQVFEPFFTTKPLGEGTGLGLATVYGVVRQNGGFTQVYSEPGKGSTFRIFLPRHSGERERGGREGQDAPVPPGAGVILLVEDDELVRRMARGMLKAIGYEVLLAGTPQEALRICEAEDRPIDLLLTDVILPGMNGKELRDRVEALRPAVRTLFMSGYTADVIARHGVLDPDVDFIQKPFRMLGLAEKIREVLGG